MDAASVRRPRGCGRRLTKHEGPHVAVCDRRLDARAEVSANGRSPTQTCRSGPGPERPLWTHLPTLASTLWLWHLPTLSDVEAPADAPPPAPRLRQTILHAHAAPSEPAARAQERIQRALVEAPLGWALSEAARDSMDQTMAQGGGDVGGEFAILRAVLAGDTGGYKPCLPR